MSHRVDVHVGQRLRQRRWMLGLTQQNLAQKVGIRFQQIQKYETGENRVSASRLWELAAALGVPVTYLYEGLDGPADNGETARADMLADREAIELVRAFYTLPQTQRQHLFDLARVLSGTT